MIVRRSCVLVVVLLGLAQATPAQAQFIKKIVHSIVLDSKRNNCWPQPFVMPDRQTVRAPIEMMVRAGWEHQNLLGNHHFDEKTGGLTEAGELKARWVATQVPSHHRMIYVSRADSLEETSARLAAVEALTAHLTGEDPPPRVAASDLDPGGWPANRVDVIGRKFQDGMPEPRLPDYDPNAGGD